MPRGNVTAGPTGGRLRGLGLPPDRTKAHKRSWRPAPTGCSTLALAHETEHGSVPAILITGAGTLVPIFSTLVPFFSTLTATHRRYFANNSSDTNASKMSGSTAWPCAASAVPVQTWQGRAKSGCRRGRGQAHLFAAYVDAVRARAQRARRDGILEVASPAPLQPTPNHLGTRCKSSCGGGGGGGESKRKQDWTMDRDTTTRPAQ